MNSKQMINSSNSSFGCHMVHMHSKQMIFDFIPYQQVDFKVALKYLGFDLKPNNYGIKD